MRNPDSFDREQLFTHLNSKRTLFCNRRREENLYWKQICHMHVCFSSAVSNQPNGGQRKIKRRIKEIGDGRLPGGKDSFWRSVKIPPLPLWLPSSPLLLLHPPLLLLFSYFPWQLCSETIHQLLLIYFYFYFINIIW